MKTGKQILCFFLALALILGLLPATVQSVRAVEADQSATEPLVDLKAVDHSDDVYIAMETEEPAQVPEADSSQEEENTLQILLFF